MKKILIPILSLAAALFYSGCASPGAKTPINTTKYDVENHEPAVLLDSGAQTSVTYSGLQVGQTPDGRLQVAANVRNRENRRIQVQINCEFKDEQGFTIDSTPFENLFLDENAQQTVRFVSMNDKAKKYTIRIRQAR